MDITSLLSEQLRQNIIDHFNRFIVQLSDLSNCLSYLVASLKLHQQLNQGLARLISRIVVVEQVAEKWFQNDTVDLIELSTF